MKEAYYFSHDSNARYDPKITAMRSVYGSKGYGWFWILVELMREQDGYKLDMRSKYAYHAFASQMQCEAEEAQCFIKDCVSEFGLFESDEQWFWSASLVRRMRDREEKSEKARNSANARWSKKTAPDKGLSANAEQPQSADDANAFETDALKERKVKESKDKKKLKESRQLKYAEDSLYYKMALYHHKKIMEYAASISVVHLVQNANLQTWANDMRKLVEIDSRNKDEVRQVIDFVSGDSFWRKNILSPEKLRKQYTQVGVLMADRKVVPINTKDQQQNEINELDKFIEEEKRRGSG